MKKVIMEEADHIIDMFGDIKAFHKKFDLCQPSMPQELSSHLSEFRTKFMQEELDEYTKAKNLEDRLDALVDLVYVVLGTAYLHGFDFNEAWRRVHHANMQKVRVKTACRSKRGSAYDVVKPDGWKAPDLSDLV